MLFQRLGILAVCLCLHACGGGGSGSGNSGTGQAAYGRINLQSTVPADAAVQVALDAKITLRFDTVMVLDCMRDEDTWLRVVDSTANVSGQFALQEAGRTVTFTPDAPLLPETDYYFQVSPLTCDQSGRLLETAVRITFRTLDDTPPRVVSANVLPGENGRSRTAPLVLTLSETLAAASVTATTVVLRDTFNQRYPCTRLVNGTTLSVQPLADLPGDRQLTLQIGATVTDRAGNPLGAIWSVLFRTATDTVSPSATSLWPPNNSTLVSPAIQPIVTFDESMDPATVEPSSLLFQDEFGSLVAFAVEASPDQRTLRVHPRLPLQPNRHYVMAFLVSGASVTDVSGNGLTSTLALSFTTGTDVVPPRLLAADPAQGTTRVSINARPVLTFDGALDASWVGDATVQLRQNGELVAIVLDRPASDRVRLTPVLPLVPSATYTVHVVGGHAGLRDSAGNVLATDLDLAFTATDDATLPTAMLQPADGAVNVPLGAKASIVFDAPVDPTTISASTVQLRADDGTPLAATVSLGNGDRVVTVVPTTPLQGGLYYRTFVRGGEQGVRELSGNWLATDLGAHFRIGTTVDAIPPAVTATINQLDALRRPGVLVPPSGFSIDISASDGSQVPDMGSVAIELDGPGTPPTAAALFATATVGFRTLRAIVSPTTPLAVGQWSAAVRVADLSGNVGNAASLSFTVAEPDGALVPFERTQVVWARTDMDRDGNGRPDFDDDLVRLGLATPGDPRNTTTYVRRLLLDAVLATANSLYGRGPRGEPIDLDSVSIRFTTHQPIGIGHLQIALGGLDPEGVRNRAYGDQSTGVLGRAFFDARNADTNDRDVATSPGLGVFPAEMFLYQADIHRQVYPSFQTMWAQRFLPLCPDLGGTPAGSNSIDSVVLTASFDPDHATSEQQARWLVVMRAIDDWAVVIGTVLAHEVGHSVGLVAPGPAPSGLFGDASLHNTNASAAEVMAPSVGYEAMITLGYNFRDINIAYLRHRILQR